ncbi:3958_t:CDS:2 [Gigaspora margarita]|uniref:3958_t:CDS:1 n=1 Tax=Gigaspora margarita TaxID=4874 RepID=A0ABM8VW63_GIGMA|nr:3958_t:CDS:2 [Gigaspora margarita]
MNLDVNRNSPDYEEGICEVLIKKSVSKLQGDSKHLRDEFDKL